MSPAFCVVENNLFVNLLYTVLFLLCVLLSPPLRFLRMRCNNNVELNENKHVMLDISGIQNDLHQ